MRGFSNSHKGNVRLNPIPHATIRKRSTIRSVDDSLFISSIYWHSDWHSALSDRLSLRPRRRANMGTNRYSQSSSERPFVSAGELSAPANSLQNACCSPHRVCALLARCERGRRHWMMTGTRPKSVKGQGYAFVSGEEWRSERLVA